MAPPIDLETSVFNYLRTRHCRPTQDWIRSVLPSGIYTTEASNGRYEDQLYRRWLKLDWNDPLHKTCSNPALPATVSLDHILLEKRTLTDTYLVQITVILDISKPLAYELEEKIDQLAESDGEDDADDGNEFAKLFKKGSKLADSKGKSKAKNATNPQRFTTFGSRMLQLGLSDGHVDCVAIEYQPIPALTVGHLGAKILLTGPFDFRVGTFLLRPQNVKIIYEVPAVERDELGIPIFTPKVRNQNSAIPPGDTTVKTELLTQDQPQPVSAISMLSDPTAQPLEDWEDSMDEADLIPVITPLASNQTATITPVNLTNSTEPTLGTQLGTSTTVRSDQNSTIPADWEEDMEFDMSIDEEITSTSNHILSQNEPNSQESPQLEPSTPISGDAPPNSETPNTPNTQERIMNSYWEAMNEECLLEQ